MKALWLSRIQRVAARARARQPLPLGGVNQYVTDGEVTRREPGCRRLKGGPAADLPCELIGFIEARILWCGHGEWRLLLRAAL